MSRRLTGEERELWDRLRKSVRPLRAERAEKPTAADGVATKEQPPRPAAAAPTQPPKAPPPASPPPLVPFEPRLRRRLSRGLVGVEARIDLHGMRQERAFAALFSFLRHAQQRGQKIVLVITGRGREDDTGRGVLRAMVPAWLARSDFRELVAGVEEAGRRHGGSGALYVRLRRRGRRDRAS
jgi:DNA-nicking Smr family endonuclease